MFLSHTSELRRLRASQRDAPAHGRGYEAGDYEQLGSLGTASAYVWRAKKVDAPAAGMVAPYVGWIGFANVLTAELWRKNEAKPTIH